MLPRKRTALRSRAAGGGLRRAGALQLSPEDGETWEAAAREKICGQKPKGRSERGKELTYGPWKHMASVGLKAEGRHSTPHSCGWQGFPWGAASRPDPAARVDWG